MCAKALSMARERFALWSIQEEKSKQNQIYNEKSKRQKYMISAKQNEVK